MMRLGLVLVTVVMLVLGGCAQPDVGPEASPASDKETAESQAEPPLSVRLSGPESHEWGEYVRYGFMLGNTSVGPIVIDPYPPAEQVTCLDTGVIVYSVEGEGSTKVLDPDFGVPPTFGGWSPVDENEQPVPPGMYELTKTYVVHKEDTDDTWTVSATYTFEIVDREDMRTGELEVNQSVTSEGLTVTLTRLEMTATQLTVHTFTTPPDYELPEEGHPYEYEAFVLHSHAH